LPDLQNLTNPAAWLINQRLPSRAQTPGMEIRYDTTLFATGLNLQ
jgi:hypothetical protein